MNALPEGTGPHGSDAPRALRKRARRRMRTAVNLRDPACRSVDDLVQLRIWGSDEIFLLPSEGNDLIIGTGSSCAIRIRDRTGNVSGRHARLSRAGARWIVSEIDGTVGIKLDGLRHAEFPLDPGVELAIGGVTLIAECARLLGLRKFLSRLLGWSRNDHVDLAMRAMRMALARRVALVLCGSDDLVAIASALHRFAVGDDRPFVHCAPPRRGNGPGVRSLEHHELAVPAMAAAAGGSLCVWSNRLPRDFPEVAAALHGPGAGAQLIVCTDVPGGASQLLASAQIVIPRLADRESELDRIIDEYGADEAARLSSRGATFTAGDREWVRKHSAASLAEIEKGTRRLVALRLAGSMTRAATMLNMSHVALAEWFQRRRRPTKIIEP
jgi:hypothetical protein